MWVKICQVTGLLYELRTLQELCIQMSIRTRRESHKAGPMFIPEVELFYVLN